MNSASLVLVVAIAAAGAGSLGGCAVTRGQEPVGAYIDDTTVTSTIKAKYVADKSVDASAISVETLKGVVQLSGFARTDIERARAVEIARQVRVVTSVTNSIVVRP